jgi:hypothetical protein
MQKKALILAKFRVFSDVFFPKLPFDDSFLASPDHANALDSLISQTPKHLPQMLLMVLQIP